MFGLCHGQRCYGASKISDHKMFWLQDACKAPTPVYATGAYALYPTQQAVASQRESSGNVVPGACLSLAMYRTTVHICDRLNYKMQKTFPKESMDFRWPRTVGALKQLIFFVNSKSNIIQLAFQRQLLF